MAWECRIVASGPLRRHCCWRGAGPAPQGVGVGAEGGDAAGAREGARQYHIPGRRHGTYATALLGLAGVLRRGGPWLVLVGDDAAAVAAAAVGAGDAADEEARRRHPGQAEG